MKQTLIVNLMAGPGAGKSTTAAKVFSLLKEQDINCELVREFAKDLSWIKDMKTLSDQYYVTGTQHYRQHMVDGTVDVMVTDSPLIIGLLYYSEPNIKIKNLYTRFIVEQFKSQNNMNFYIDRKKKYNPAGRNQTKEEAVQKDVLTKNLLDTHKIPYTMIVGDTTAATKIAACIIKEIS